MLHELKTLPQYYARVTDLQKTFEARKNDRDFQVGDILRLKEWYPKENEFTGYFMEFKIEYILHGGQFGIENGYVVMSIKPFDPCQS